MTEAELAAIIRGIAPIVRELIAKAMSELTPRVAAVEVTLSRLPAHEQSLGSLLERVIVVETKNAVQRLEAAPIDLTPLLERVAAFGARLDTLGDLRDRVITIETKADSPAATDLGDLPTRVAVLETQMAAHEERIAGLEQEQADLAAAARVEVKATEAALVAAGRELSAVRERVAVVEVRPPIPGPPGKDGADGLGWDDLSVVHDGDRTFTLQMARGDQRKDVGTFAVPYMIYRGVFQEGRTYAKGDMVTWAGSLWLVNESTAIKPDDLSKAWTLCVKRGRDGKDGRDAPGALPVVSVGGSR